jgi:hypothetical protein
VRYVVRAVRSVFSEKKKLSIAALSQQIANRAHGADGAVIGHQFLESLIDVDYPCRLGRASTLSLMQA